ncbi:MAG: hypothetical protein QGI45_04995, partial [Myxococcota bacterium]|nr:hypothetical protein [Myxococcota bacterium]
MSIAAAFFFMAFVVAGVRDRTTFCYCVLHVSLTFFLCAFWILPFALSDRVELSPMILFKLSAFEISVITFLLTTYLICRQPHRVFTKPLMKTHIAFWGVVLLIGTLQVISSLFFYDLRLRYHRFYMLYFLFMPILGCSVLELLSSPLKKRLYAVFTILAIALALYFDKTTPKGIDDVFVPQLEKLDGRVFVHTKPTEYARHVVQHRLPMESGNIAIKGLFAESSGNAEYLFNVERIMLGAHARRRDVPWWGFEWPRWLVSYEMRSHLSDYFRLFQVNYIFTNRVLSIPDVSIVDRKNLGEGFWLYKVGEHDLFEVLDEMPEIIPKERAAMRTWLFGEGP